jgi:hypothetical protein
MGSLRGLVVLALLSACDTSGIEIVVLPPGEGAAAPDRIRLFIGNADEMQGAIAPESFAVGEERDGYVWTRDPTNVGDIVPGAGGESVSFGFVAQSDHTEFGAVIAVGYTGDAATSAGSLFHVRTGVGNVQVYELTLYPAVDPRKTENRTEQLQLEIWGPEPGDETCVHLFNMRPDRDLVDPHDSAFIVSANDRDCDGYADDDGALECVADVHDATEPAEAGDLSCVTPISSSNPTWCVLGGPLCVDGAARDPGGCTASRFCGPTSMCTRCRSLSGAAEQDCVRDPFMYNVTGDQMFGIACHVPTRQDSATGTGPTTFCDAPISLVGPVAQMLINTTCDNATIGSAGQPPRDRLEIDQMKFRVDVTPTCGFTLTPSGELPANFAKASGLVTVDLGTGRSVALPIVILPDPPTPDCATTDGECRFTGDPLDRPSQQCLTAPPP